MIKDSDAQKCMGFLEVVRTMIDNAEVEIASATRSENAAHYLNKASCMIGVASTNLVWVSEEVVRIALKLQQENNSASAVDRPTAGNTLESEQKTGSHSLPV
jgi:hypothetical protein